MATTSKLPFKISKVLDALTAATDTQNTSGVDMENFEHVLFVFSFGTAASNNESKLQAGADNSSDCALRYSRLPWCIHQSSWMMIHHME